jgi:hypothetical protein
LPPIRTSDSITMKGGIEAFIRQSPRDVCPVGTKMFIALRC